MAQFSRRHVLGLGVGALAAARLAPAFADNGGKRLHGLSAFGELKHALDAGLLTRNDVHAELGAIAAGLKPGRANDREITIADLTGVGFQDTAIASAAFRWIQEQ